MGRSVTALVSWLCDSNAMVWDVRLSQVPSNECMYSYFPLFYRLVLYTLRGLLVFSPSSILYA